MARRQTRPPSPPPCEGAARHRRRPPPAPPLRRVPHGKEPWSSTLHRRMGSASSPPDTLTANAVIANRFTLQRLAGRGGMGCVYRAQDSQTGRPVALKLLHTIDSPEAARRFAREAQAAGRAAPPRHRLLRGPRRAPRRASPSSPWSGWRGRTWPSAWPRQPLSLSETLSAAAPRRRGARHRPRARASSTATSSPPTSSCAAAGPEDVVLLDFGLARPHAPRRRVTGSAHGAGHAGLHGARAGLQRPGAHSRARTSSPWAACSTSASRASAPFRAPHFAAALAKILFAEPRPLRTLRPELPGALQALVERMLAKDPAAAARRTASACCGAGGAGGVPELLPPPSRAEPRAPRAWPDAEQQLVSVAAGHALGAAHELPTLDAGTRTRPRALREPADARCSSPTGPRLELLADGSLLATLRAGARHRHGPGRPGRALRPAHQGALAREPRWCSPRA